MTYIRNILLTLLLIGCGSTQESGNNESSDQKATKEVQSPAEEKKVILFFGNSITAGYQLDMDQAFPALIQERIDSLGLNYKTINAGLSGETSAGGKSRIEWVLQTVPDIFFLELGANDGLRGLPLDETIKNLQDIIDAVKNENPEVEIIIAGMMVPPNLGQGYSDKFSQIFPKLAEANDATLIPFVLEGVAGNPELNLSDGIHPTPEGHEIVADTVWKYLEPLL
ncbi:acyl-CoA thioesterase-1 [Ekhidna lutea]|uniref:Acyl-CoA thioesterase-1 n=1 Tax=Ekhidna lutea TaxID=447679 RepID=A0A239M7R9_EKHLU|nr:arylesterase [Ekhidna lutea]SNT38163.1 acyl-CoA thioesterase-1 [Ekhidna lutea]